MIYFEQNFQYMFPVLKKGIYFENKTLKSNICFLQSVFLKKVIRTKIIMEKKTNSASDGFYL